MLTGEPGVDDRVEGDVVVGGGSCVQRRVAEQDVPQLVHHEQEQVLVTAAVLGDEARVDQQPGPPPTGDGRRRDGLGLLDADQPHERLELEAGAGQAAGEPFGEAAGAGGVDARSRAVSRDGEGDEARVVASPDAHAVAAAGSSSSGMAASRRNPRGRSSTLSVRSSSLHTTEPDVFGQVAVDAGAAGSAPRQPVRAPPASSRRASIGRVERRAAASGPTNVTHGVRSTGTVPRHPRARPRRHVVQQRGVPARLGRTDHQPLTSNSSALALDPRGNELVDVDAGEQFGTAGVEHGALDRGERRSAGVGQRADARRQASSRGPGPYWAVWSCRPQRPDAPSRPAATRPPASGRARRAPG